MHTDKLTPKFGKCLEIFVFLPEMGQNLGMQLFSKNILTVIQPFSGITLY